jgi:lipid-A-disaccharide synthase
VVRTLNHPAADRAEARRILIVAGEPSGDLHAAGLVRALRRRGPIEVRGIAGPRLRAEGAEALVAQEDLAVIGFSGILARLPALFAARDRVLRELASFRPHAVVLVDYPGFNLRLGPLVHRAGARVFYYIGPQVWAWHPERAAAMARWVTRLAVVFPFEEPLFREAGVPTTFVGHPLLDELEPEVEEAALRAEIGAAPDAPLVGLLPGSRRGELAQHAGPMLDAARRLRKAHPDARAVLALAGGLTLEGVEPSGLEGVAVVRGRTRAVQAFSTCCAVASGTATLETALFGTPLVVCYRVGWLNYAIARRLVKLTHIGLPNIVAGEEVAPELIQGALTGEALARHLGGWLGDPAARHRQHERLAVVREKLGGPGASARAADALWETMA